MNNYDRMDLTKLIRNMHRLAWAADTTDDYKWREEHLFQREYVVTLILKKFNAGRTNSKSVVSKPQNKVQFLGSATNNKPS